MKEALRNRLGAFYDFSYPVYSGSVVKCKGCHEEEWFTGNEIRGDARNGFLKIFQHSSTCHFKKRIADEFDGKPIKTISSLGYSFACDNDTIRDIVNYAEACGYKMSLEVKAQLIKRLKR